MAVNELTNSVTGNGNGSARTFSFSPVVISKSSDLVVVKKDINGLETPLSEGTTSATYSVSVSGYPGTGSIDYPAVGGTLLATGESITMRSVRELTQPADLENQGGYFADTQEAMHDKHTYIDQQQQVELNRSIKIPVSDGALDTVLPTAELRASKALVFDASGNVVVGTPTTQTVVGYDDTDTDATKDKMVDNLRMNDLSQLQRGEITYHEDPTILNGFLKRIVKRIFGATSWATQATLTPSTSFPNSSGFTGYVKAVLTGVTTSQGEGGLVVEYLIDDNDTPIELRRLEWGTAPPQFQISVTSDVHLFQVQSSDGTSAFKGALDLEILIPPDGQAGDGGSWTIS